MAFVSWIIGAIVVFVILGLLYKSQDIFNLVGIVRKYALMIIVMGIVLFFLYSLWVINDTYDLDLKTSEGIASAIKIYLVWGKTVVNNMASVTGYAVQQDWFVKNQTVQ
jgi:hypothetical protein